MQEFQGLRQKWLAVEGNANLEDHEWEGYLNEKEEERREDAEPGTIKYTTLSEEINHLTLIVNKFKEL